VHADEQIVAGKAVLDRLLIGSDGDRIGVLVKSAVTGGPPRSASWSPVRIAPMRDWSSMRIEGSRASLPSITLLFRWKIASL
jgi:hypothetical protein